MVIACLHTLRPSSKCGTSWKSSSEVWPRAKQFVQPQLRSDQAPVEHAYRRRTHVVANVVGQIEILRLEWMCGPGGRHEPRPTVDENHNRLFPMP